MYVNSHYNYEIMAYHCITGPLMLMVHSKQIYSHNKSIAREYRANYIQLYLAYIYIKKIISHGTHLMLHTENEELLTNIINSMSLAIISLMIFNRF